MIFNELTSADVIDYNRMVIADIKRLEPGSDPKHVLVKRSDLESCIGGIFFRMHEGNFVNTPLEKMAGLVLYRIAQGQFFMDGNKRTALVACVMFLESNGHRLEIDKNQINELLWGFGDLDPLTGKSIKGLDDSIQYIYDHICPADFR